jgi:hypothetical protein
MLASLRTAVHASYLSLYGAIKSLKLITDPSTEGDPYIMDAPQDKKIEFSLRLKSQLISRRRMTFRV